MFDPCRRWRRLRTRTRILITQWEALEAHIAQCPRCRQEEAAERALRSVLRMPVQIKSEAKIQAFDNAILAALKTNPREAPPTFQQMLENRWNVFVRPFLNQIAGGTLVAASVTALFLFYSLRPAEQEMKANRSSASSLAVQRNVPPVPLEMLLESHSPRAALLWSTPETRPNRSPRSRLEKPVAGPFPEKTPRLNDSSRGETIEDAFRMG